MKEKAENYQEIGSIRFKKDDRQWWMCLSDLVAKFPPSLGFRLEDWISRTEGLDEFLATDGNEVWGVYAVAIELARLPTDPEFRGLPLWVARQMRRAD